MAPFDPHASQQSCIIAGALLTSPGEARCELGRYLGWARPDLASHAYTLDASVHPGDVAPACDCFHLAADEVRAVLSAGRGHANESGDATQDPLIAANDQLLSSQRSRQRSAIDRAREPANINRSRPWRHAERNESQARTPPLMSRAIGVGIMPTVPDSTRCRSAIHQRSAHQQC